MTMPEPPRRAGPDSADVEPYTALAAAYDLVMEHVDYDAWAEYVDGLLDTYAPAAVEVLEVGCGTGMLAKNLLGLRQLQYFATDLSEEMVREARARLAGWPVEFAVADFRRFDLQRSFDAALLLYDGINYLMSIDEVAQTLVSVRRHVPHGGIFVLDQSTPANSLNNQSFFEDSGVSGGVSYVRQSLYDEETMRHHTRFDLVVDGRRFREHHVQRAHTVADIREAIYGTDWSIEAAFEGFTRDPATEDSERVHWILRSV